MANTNIILGIGALVVGVYAYTQGWLCKLNIPQLCPSGGGGGGGGTYQPYENPDTNISGFPPNVVGGGHHIPPYPAGGRLHQYPRTGYGDEGYGDDYGYESNAAHISIA